MVSLDDLIHIYVDFIPITSTTSPDDALSLLISMYTIFELNFPKNNRTVRLLYSLFHGEKRFLSNTIRSFIREKDIEISEEIRQDYKTIFTSTTVSPETTAELCQSSTEVVSSPVIRSSNDDPSNNSVSHAGSGSPLKLFMPKDS